MSYFIWIRAEQGVLRRAKRTLGRPPVFSFERDDPELVLLSGHDAWESDELVLGGSAAVGLVESAWVALEQITRDDPGAVCCVEHASGRAQKFPAERVDPDPLVVARGDVFAVNTCVRVAVG